MSAVGYEGRGPRAKRPVAAPLLNLAHLARQTGGDSALAIDLLTLFQAQSRQALGGLAEADPEATGALAHRLKGAARTIGAVRVADAAEAVEIAAYANRSHDDRLASYLMSLNVALAHTLGSIALVLRGGGLGVRTGLESFKTAR